MCVRSCLPLGLSVVSALDLSMMPLRTTKRASRAARMRARAKARLCARARTCSMHHAQVYFNACKYPIPAYTISLALVSQLTLFPICACFPFCEQAATADTAIQVAAVTHGARVMSTQYVPAAQTYATPPHTAREWPRLGGRIVRLASRLHAPVSPSWGPPNFHKLASPTAKAIGSLYVLMHATPNTSAVQYDDVHVVASEWCDVRQSIQLYERGSGPSKWQK
eukprot:3808578-Pleurochrysis_carterae.AAC.5